ncbi:MAG: hypothetical protein QM756_07895 [Polyangiaceae bacterium]
MTLMKSRRRRSRFAQLAFASALTTHYFACTPDFEALKDGGASGGKAVTGGQSSSGGSEQGGTCEELACGGAPGSGGSLVRGGSGGVVEGSGGFDGNAAGAGGVLTSAGAPAGGVGADAGAGGESGAAMGGSGLGGAASGGAASGGTLGSGGGVTTGPVVHFDFETPDLGGWQSVGDPRPPDAIDEVALSTDDKHHGNSSLKVVLDGEQTALPSGTYPYCGVYTPIDAPTANSTVTIWVRATISAMPLVVYVQAKPDYAWSAALMTNAGTSWTKLTVPVTKDLFTIGILVNTPAAPPGVKGTLYIDEIAW